MSIPNNPIIPETGYSPVVKYRGIPKIFDFTKGYDPEYIRSFPYGIGRYNEKRNNMYLSSIYNGLRNIHMGIDFWLPAGNDVFSFADGKILCFRDNANPLDYGPTIVTEHLINGSSVYALYGHLSRESLNSIKEGQSLHQGEKFAEIGSEVENGGWVPHLHFQLSLKKPKEPDMPGVVAESDLKEELKIYPDPRLVLGRLY